MVSSSSRVADARETGQRGATCDGNGVSVMGSVAESGSFSTAPDPSTFGAGAGVAEVGLGVSFLTARDVGLWVSSTVGDTVGRPKFTKTTYAANPASISTASARTIRSEAEEGTQSPYPQNSRMQAAAQATCSSLRWGWMGRLSTSCETRSVTGSDPFSPRCAYGE